MAIVAAGIAKVLEALIGYAKRSGGKKIWDEQPGAGTVTPTSKVEHREKETTF
ncbi:hypothetical protein S83_004626 [Arachis hypogaea]